MTGKKSIFSFDLLRSELLKNTTILISGAMVAQLLSLLLQPLLRRFFTPGQFGTYSVYSSIMGIITIISALKYDDAIVLPKSDKDAANLVGLSLLANIILNSSIFIIVLIFGSTLVKFLNLPSGFPVMILAIIPIGAIIFSSYNSLNAWLIRKKKYMAISANKLIRRSSEGFSQLSLAFLKINNALIYSDVIGQVANVATVSVQAKKSGFNSKMISRKTMRHVFREYSEFPKYNLLPAFMSTCSFLLPSVFINKFFSAESAGYFDLSKTVLSIPVAFIASSLGSVLLQKVSEKYLLKESVYNELKPIFLLVALISLCQILIISFFGESLFEFVFGKEWGTSGYISRILVWSLTANFIISSFSNIFVGMRKIKVYSLWQVIYFLAIISLIFFKHLPFIDFLKIYVLFEIFCYLIVSVFLTKILLNYESKIAITKET